MDFSGQHPIHGLPPLAEANPEMTFLEKAEIEKLLNVLAGDDLNLSCFYVEHWRKMDGSCHAKTSTDYKLQGYLPENPKTVKANRADF